MCPPVASVPPPLDRPRPLPGFRGYGAAQHPTTGHPVDGSQMLDTRPRRRLRSAESSRAVHSLELRSTHGCGGSWERGGKGMSRLIFGWLTVGIASLPAWLGYALADAATALHWLFFPGRRHAALANLAVILPRASRRDRARVARRMMRSHTRLMYEFVRLPHLSREELLASVEVVGKEHLDRGIARGRGVILAATHLGNWELAGVMVAQWGYALHAVAGVQLARWLSGAVRDTKTELSITTIAPEDGFRKIMRALEHNDPVALMVDGNLYAHGHTVEWFGRPPPFPAGQGVLAQRTGALLISGYCERPSPGRFRIVLEPPLDPAAFAWTAELHQAVASIAERHIREHIDQWCIFRPLWAVPAAQSAEEPAAERAHAGPAAGGRGSP